MVGYLSTPALVPPMFNGALSLVKSGFEVEALCFSPDSTLPSREILMEGFLVKRLRSRSIGFFHRPSSSAPRTIVGAAAQYLIKYVEFTLKMLWHAILSRADLYEAHDLPALLPVFLASVLRRKPFAYHAHEMYAEIQRKVPFARVWKTLERWQVPHADVVVTPEENRSRILYLEGGAKKMPLTVRNCPPFAAPVRSTLLRDRLRERGRDPRTIVLYQGLFDDSRCLAELVDAARQFEEGVLLVLVGSGFGIWEYPERTLSGVPNVEVMPRVAYEQLYLLTASADIGVLLYRNDCRNNYYCAPNKIFEYMMMGLPVIANDFPGIARLVRDENVGLCVDATKPEGIAEAVNKLAHDRELYQSMRSNCLDVSRSKYNWELEYKKLLHAYHDTIGLHEPGSDPPNPRDNRRVESAPVAEEAMGTARRKHAAHTGEGYEERF